MFIFQIEFTTQLFNSRKIIILIQIFPFINKIFLLRLKSLFSLCVRDYKQRIYFSGISNVDFDKIFKIKLHENEKKKLLCLADIIWQQEY